MGRVAITGGSGFIGTNLVEHYRALGWDVLNISDVEPTLARHRGFWREASILDERALGAALSDFKPKLLIHLAARTDLDGTTLADYAANTIGVQNVVAAVNRTASLERAIYASTRLVFRVDHQPRNDYDYSATTMYGKSKIEGERVVKSQPKDCVPWTLIRPTTIWGPHGAAGQPAFFVQVLRGHYVHPRGRRILKTFGYVGNVVYEIAKLGEAPREAVAGKAFFVADYAPVEVREWADMIRRAAGAGAVRDVPLAVLKAASRLGDLLNAAGLKVPLTTFRLGNLLTPMEYDMSALQAVVGPLPHTLEESVAATVAWLRDAGRV